MLTALTDPSEKSTNSFHTVLRTVHSAYQNSATDPKVRLRADTSSRVFDNAACLNASADASANVYVPYMLPCTFLHSFTGMDVLQVEQLQETCGAIMLSLPQTLPARMYVPYLAGEVHMSAISLPASVQSVQSWLQCSILCPPMHQSSMCSFAACSSALAPPPCTSKQGMATL